MLEKILFVSIILNILAGLVIAKKNSIIKEQNYLLRIAAPIIDQLYKERFGEDE